MSILTRKICGVYKITNLTNGKCYVGQSVDIHRRWKSHRHEGKQNHNAYLHRAIHKYGLENFSFEILETCDVGALDELEKKYISMYNCIAPNGYNMDLGGCVRKELGEETRKKRARFGKQNGNYGKHKSDWFKRMIAVVRSKPVNQYTLDGKYINTYPNSREVSGFQSGREYQAIGMCCRGKIARAYGYQWRFASQGNGDIEPIEGARAKNNVPISQYALDGSFLATYPNAKAASSATGADYKSILAVCKGRPRKAGGYQWRYAGKYFCDIDPWVNTKGLQECVRVSQYTTDGRYMKTYNSMMEAAQSANTSISSISQCVCGRSKTAAGFVWRRENGDND